LPGDVPGNAYRREFIELVLFAKIRFGKQLDVGHSQLYFRQLVANGKNLLSKHPFDKFFGRLLGQKRNKPRYRIAVDAQTVAFYFIGRDLEMGEIEQPELLGGKFKPIFVKPFGVSGIGPFYGSVHKR
jgi:hypothetical protein